MLRIGKIDYLNIWHIFQLLQNHCPEGQAFQYISGHPNQLNTALDTDKLDVSPSSVFEYLVHAPKYHLLRNASISAQREVQSVLFLTPCSLQKLPQWLCKHPGPVCLTSASATSTALLKILWEQKWRLPPVSWQIVHPGTGLHTGRPFLEIGNLALQHFLHPPKGFLLYDLAAEWTTWTHLPFVFAVWIARRRLSHSAQKDLLRLQHALSSITPILSDSFPMLLHQVQRPAWLPQPDLLQYWQAMQYNLSASEQASIILFARYCEQAGLLSAAPVLTWI